MRRPLATEPWSWANGTAYTVTAIDRTGNESAPSLAAEVTAQ
jgi:hypothetical protein